MINAEVNTGIREEPSYKYLKELMLNKYSLDLVSDKKVFKEEILKLYNIKDWTWLDELDFGEFKLIGSDRFILFFVDLIKHFKFNLKDIEGKRILDIGPASGGTSLLFLALGAKDVIAVEANAFNVKRMEFLSRSFNLNLHPILTPFEDFECDDKFDFINCYGVFYFIKGQKKSLSKMRDMLNSTGKLFIETKTNEEKGNVKSEKFEEWLTEANFKFEWVYYAVRSFFIAMAKENK